MMRTDHPIKILALLGSPRKGGNSETLLRAVLKGAEAGGGEIEVVRLAQKTIGPCIGCGGCDKTGECVVKDDMQELYPGLDAADRIILASPIYFYSVTAQAKCCIDRFQARWNRKHLAIKRGDYQLDSHRKGYLVAVAATKGENVFAGAVLTMKYAYDALGIAYGGEFLVKGVDSRGEMKQRTADLENAEAFGRSII